MDIIKTIIVVIVCVAFSILFYACDDKNPTKPENPAPLAGTWDIIKMSSEYEGETVSYNASQLDSVGLIWTLKFEENGTMEQTTNMSGTVVTFPGIWAETGNELTMKLTGHTGEESTIIYEFVIEGYILKLNWAIPAGTKFYAEFERQE